MGRSIFSKVVGNAWDTTSPGSAKAQPAGSNETAGHRGRTAGEN